MIIGQPDRNIPKDVRLHWHENSEASVWRRRLHCVCEKAAHLPANQPSFIVLSRLLNIPAISKFSGVDWLLLPYEKTKHIAKKQWTIYHPRLYTAVLALRVITTRRVISMDSMTLWLLEWTLNVSNQVLRKVPARNHSACKRLTSNGLQCSDVNPTQPDS